ncbi:hypothetical protein Tco_0471301 [Tanacetum coccineum]
MLFGQKSRFEYGHIPKSKDGASTSKDGATASTYESSNVDFKANGATTYSNKGHVISSDINLVTLRNSFAALNEKDNVFKNVDVLNAGNYGNTAKDATKVGDDTDSDFEDVYDEAARFMASSSKPAIVSGGANEANFREDENCMYDDCEDFAYDLTKE